MGGTNLAGVYTAHCARGNGHVCGGGRGCSGKDDPPRDSPRFHFRGCVGVGAGGLPRSDGDDGWSVYISLKISGSAEKC